MDSRFLPADFFALRTTLLPFDTFLTWSDGLEAPRSLNDAERLEDAVKSDRLRLRQRLRTLVARPEIREALFLASPDLDGALPRWLDDPDSKKGRRTERALVRYFSRMCGRATPFGLFAGHSVGRTGERTRIELDAAPLHRRHTRLDMDYLSSLIDALVRDPVLQTTLVYHPNSSIYRSAGRLRYAESRLKGKARSYHLVAVEETKYLLETLSRAEHGATVSDLALALSGDDVTVEEAEGYVRELIRSQLLVPDLAPRATGPEPIHDLAAQLRRHDATRIAAERLDDIRQALAIIDEQPPGIAIDRYRELAGTLESLPAPVEIARLFQVDMIKSAPDAMLGPEILSELARAVDLVHALRPSAPDDDLTRFRDEFRARYEHREMPLLDVLDEESGIGFGIPRGSHADAPPLFDGQGPAENQVDERRSWSALETFLLDKLQAMARAGAGVLELDENEIAPFRAKSRPPLADSFAAFAKIAASSPEALGQGDFTISFTGAWGPSGANLLGRFCHGDPRLYDSVKRYIAAEEALQPDALFAEIVHLPEGRIGNVILRPLLRSYEIPYLGRASVDEEHQIPVSDLLVSVRGNRIVLRSKRLAKEVVPRLTSAHSFRRGLGVYRFLGALQHQNTSSGIAWHWGALETAAFLPRVRIGRVVLSVARWRVEKNELRTIVDAAGADRYRLVQRWRERRNLPRFVLLADADNTLPFDLENVLSVETLVELVKKRTSFRLLEMYPGPDELCATAAEGRFVHELVVPFTVQREVVRATPLIDFDADALPRTFPPGSEWLYARLYTGIAGAERLLQEVVSPLARQAMHDGSANQWFFLRYSDPQWHLRIRFHGDPRRLADEVLLRLRDLCAPLLENGLLWKIELGMYEREIERYGRGEAMLLAEEVFHIDSDAALEVLANASDDDSVSDARWLLALRGTDQMLDDLGMDLEGKLAVISSSRRAFLAETHAGPSVEHQLGERFRTDRKRIESLLDRRNDHSSALSRALKALDVRSQRLRPVFAALRRMAADGTLSVTLQSLAASYIHMHTNRILRSAGRMQELVINDSLRRVYQSSRARALSTLPRDA